VSVLDANSGVVQTTLRVGPAPVALVVDERAGLVYVANSTSKSVSVLRADGTGLRKTLRVKGLPVAVAVDEGTGRSFVLTAGSARGSVQILAVSAPAGVS
jgi:DNA-binding beta-propeller fold protein YncE